jgi:hypothetical protein
MLKVLDLGHLILVFVSDFELVTMACNAVSKLVSV